MTKSSLLFATLITLLSYSSFVSASEKTLIKQFDPSQLSELTIHNGVGELNIIGTDQAQIEVVVKIKSVRKWWLFNSDISGAEISSVTSGQHLELQVNEKHSNQHWLVKLPKHLALNLHLGVGELKIHGHKAHLTADVGVGSMVATIDHQAYGEVSMDAGVGDVSVDGADFHVKVQDHLVGRDLNFKGPGQANFNAHIGVGDMRLTLQNAE